MVQLLPQEENFASSFLNRFNSASEMASRNALEQLSYRDKLNLQKNMQMEQQKARNEQIQAIQSIQDPAQRQQAMLNFALSKGPEEVNAYSNLIKAQKQDTSIQDLMSILSPDQSNQQQAGGIPGISPGVLPEQGYSQPKQAPQKKISPRAWDTMSETQQAVISQKYPQAAKALQENSKMAIEAKENERRALLDEKEFASKQAAVFTKPIIEGVQKIRAELPILKQSTNDFRDAVYNNAQGFFSKNYFAEKYDMPYLKDASGAQFQKAVKERLASSYRSLPAKALTVFAEKIISDSEGKIGNSKQANASIVALDRASDDLKERYAEISEEIFAQDIEKHGYVKPDAQSRIAKELSKFDKELTARVKRQVDMIKNGDYDTLYEQFDKNGNLMMILPDGRQALIPEREVKKALKDGLKRVK